MVIRYPLLKFGWANVNLILLDNFLKMIKVQGSLLLFWMFYCERISKASRTKNCTCPALTSLMSHTAHPKTFGIWRLFRPKTQGQVTKMNPSVSSWSLFLSNLPAKTLAPPMIEVGQPCWLYLFYPSPTHPTALIFCRMCQGSWIEHLVVHRGFLSQLISKGTDWLGTLGPCAKW